MSLPAKNVDTRRWSFASINSTSSSGYGGGANTPPILTAIPSSCVKQTTSIPICSSSSNYMTDNSNPSSYNSSNEKIIINKNQSFLEKQKSIEATKQESSLSSKRSK